MSATRIWWHIRSTTDSFQVLPHRSPLKFHSNSSYLIVGGLGGIGRSLAQWFVAHGAKSLILLSRNAESHRTRFPELITDLERAGCRIALWNCDVSQQSDLSRVIEECQRNLPPIRGIIQAAMVLQVRQTPRTPNPPKKTANIPTHRTPSSKT